MTLSVIGLWPGEDQVEGRHLQLTVADSLNTWHVVTGDSAGEMFEKKLLMGYNCNYDMTTFSLVKQ